MADWEEIRRLAADFQRLQDSISAHELSERNCVEVVTRLIETGLIEVVYTLDGKEYVTPYQLEKEIKYELIAHHGRINVTELQTILNVDLNHIENKVTEILKHDRSMTLLQGELISKRYIDDLCEEINDNLQEVGQMNVADISKSFALPNNFILEVIEKSLGNDIKGVLDKSGSGTIYTETYVCRYKSRIRGQFSAITYPTPVGPIITQGRFQENLFLTILHKLTSSNDLLGSLHGHGEKAVYVPEIYIQMQNKWADSFLLSNGYLEYDALRRLGIDNPQVYVSKRYCGTSKESNVIQLKSCAIGEIILKELEGAIDDIHTSKMGWIDVLPLLPSPCVSEDAELLLCTKYGSDINLRLFGSYIVTSKFIQSCLDFFLPFIKDNASLVALEHSVLLSEVIHQREQENIFSAKSKGGKDKKRSLVKRKQQSEEAKPELQFMTASEIAVELNKSLVDSKELSGYIAHSILSTLQATFMNEAIANLSVGAVHQRHVSSNERRKRHANLQEKIQGLWNTAKLFNKGISHFEGDPAIQLSKYLLRTVCSDLTSMIVLYLAEDSGVLVKIPGELNSKERSDVISKLPDHIRTTVTIVNVSLSGKEASSFFDAYASLCGEEYCGFLLKTLDKKKERQLLFSHRQSLKRNLIEEEDYAMALHLIVVLLFQQETGSIVHMPGKFVPTMISFLSPFVPKREHEKLVECQRLISARWKSDQVSNDADKCSSGEKVPQFSLSEDRDLAINEYIRDLKQLLDTQ